MAKDKKSFIAYCDWLETFEALPNETAGELIKHLLRYVNDLDPKSKDAMVNLAFIPLRQSLKRDLKKYESYIDKQRENGAKGGRPKNQKEPKEPKPFSENPTEPKKADSVSDSVSDSETTNIYTHPINLFIKENLKNVSKMGGQPTPEQCDKLINEYGKELINDKLLAMENKSDLNKKYKSAYLTLMSWCKMQGKSRDTISTAN